MYSLSIMGDDAKAESIRKSPRKTRVLIVDDIAFVRRALVTLLSSDPSLEICGQAANGQEALQSVDELKPDVILMDVSMPVMNGLEGTRRLLAHNPGLKVLIVTENDSEELKRVCLQAGASDYVIKSQAASLLIDAINSARRG